MSELILAKSPLYLLSILMNREMGLTRLNAELDYAEIGRAHRLNDCKSFQTGVIFVILFYNYGGWISIRAVFQPDWPNAA